MAAARKIVLGGYYGYNNAGDEIILCQILEGIEKYFPCSETYVLSKNAKHFSKGFKRINRYNPFSVIYCILNAGVLIMGGGGLLQDKSGKATIYYYLLLMAAAKILGKKLIVFNQGIGPIDKFFNRLITGYIFSKTDLLIVRDSFSKKLAEKLTRNNKKVLLGADPVFSLKKSSVTPKNRKTEIALALRTWRDFPAEKMLKDINKGLAERGYRGVFFNMHPKFDTIKSEEGKIIEFSAGNNCMDSFSKFKALIGMRLHSLMLGAVAGLPMVGINYDPKVKNFCSYMEIPCFDAEEISVAGLLDSLEQEITYPKNYSEKISRLQLRLQESWMCLKEFLDKP